MNCDLSIERLFQKYHVYDIRSLIPNYGNELEEEAEIVRAEKLDKNKKPLLTAARNDIFNQVMNLSQVMNLRIMNLNQIMNLKKL